MESPIRLEKSNRIGKITLNRPEKRNAMSTELVEGMLGALGELESDEEVKVVIIAAEGKAFCAGADLAYLQQMQNFTPEENLVDSRRLMSLFDRIYNFPKPVIAQVQGHALAGGCGLVTVCDFAFTVPDALFGYTEVKIGFIPALVSIFLQEQIGAAKTQELLLSGELISAQKAAELGIVTAVTELEFLEKEVQEFTQKLIENNSGHAMTTTKALLRSLHQEERQKKLEEAAVLNAKSRSNPDCVRGISAFLNKEKPSW
ncbi:enoyl-CoA hydratase/isomerase family protein [Algoriphagus kandeliae]|uniref:Enoyl-CoA hydratase/isomerase family protein n=1 Tax=Algoriphagus kandeliae TaxID=2562278 RepID=A0A4Y9QKT8_9BACT|nr:enoyl-CoA hydratase-related protein [Algoriphagus kandeliae]TFV93324.1 enoyl-CoA hydratase/isomerase family protein [Algoriphagus kandeliae]